MLLSRGSHHIFLKVNNNISIDGDYIASIPDISMQISSLRSAPQLATIWEYIFMETVFSQLESQATHKLKEYIRSHPHTLAVMKIVIQESWFSSPSASSRIAVKYINTDVFRNEEWRPEQTDSNAFKVVYDGFTWINLTGVNITV